LADMSQILVNNNVTVVIWFSFT